MAVREFNGTTDRLILAPGAISFNGAHTVMMLVYPLSVDVVSDHAFWGAPTSGALLVEGLFLQNAGGGNVDLGSDFTGDAFVQQASLPITANQWQWIGHSKAAGTTTVTMHRSVYGSGTWTHAVTAATKANNANTPSALVIADFLVAGGAPFQLRMATWGQWNRQVANADLETLVNSLDDFKNMNGGGPVALLPFNQASTATPVADVVGTTNETSVVGTTVITGSDPPGYSFGSTGAALSGTAAGTGSATGMLTAGVTYMGAGAAATASSGNVTANFPSGAGIPAPNDILVCDVTARDNVTVTVPTGDGWAKKFETNNGTGLRKTIAWKRRGSGDSDTSVLVTHTGGAQIIARVHVIRGAVSSGDPFEVSASSTPAAAISGAFPNVTTLSPGALLLYSMAYGDDYTTAPSVTNAQGLTLTERDSTEVA